MKVRKLKFQFSMAVIIFLLCFGITWQIKGVQKNIAAQKQISNRTETLQLDLKNEMEKNEELVNRVMELRDEVEGYRNKLAQGDDSVKLMQNELARAEKMAGLSDLQGKGITVTLKDADISTQTLNGFVYDPDFGVVHDSYVLMFLNELRAAGAEALSLNDERILATSEIRCAGPTVSINNTKKAAPFVIKAIGDPETLENALKMPNGAVDQMKIYGITVTIKKENELVIEKYNGVMNYKYASEVEKKETNR